MNKKLLLAVSLLLNFAFGYSQCTYTGLTSPQVGSDYTLCIDNPNIITTAQVNAGQYVVVNVVKGFSYTFSVGDVFNSGGTNYFENLTLFNASTNTDLGVSGFIRGSSGFGAILNWTSTLSGQIKVQLSKSASCTNDNSAGGALTLALNNVGNTQDSQTAFGTDKWVGHVYNWTGSAPPGVTSPTTPSATNPFTAANYVGYYNIATEAISENFGGDYVCFPVLSNGVPFTSIYTEQFAVRYRMRSTKTGCYFLNVSGDDGVRVYVDKVLVFNQWKEQGNTSYCNNLIYLKGDSDIVLDYYENAGGNVVGFSLTPFDSSGNSIAGVAARNVCSGISPGVLDGSTFGNCTGGTNTIYQWQVSTDKVAFTDISGATLEDYTPPTQTTTTTNIVRYYRRVLKPLVNNGGRCNFESNFVTVTTSAGRPNAPGSITGSNKVCKTNSSTYSITAVANAVSYTWSTTATGWTITPSANGLSASIAFSAGATSDNLTVSASNGCGTSNSSSTLNIQVGDLPTSATISGNASVCVGATPPAITITNPQNYDVKVIYTINGGSNNEVYINANSSINYITAPTGTAGTFIYKLVSVTNGSGFENCSTLLSDSVTVSVKGISGDQTSYDSNSWIGYVYSPTSSGTPSNPFVSSNYVGYVSQTETFDLNLGSGTLPTTNLCNSYSDNFAIRFKMNKNMPAGNYTFTVGGDDGYRLSIDGGVTFLSNINNWNVHAYQTSSQTVYLSGSTNFVLEYFENAGESRVSFSYTYCATSTPPTSITGPDSVCTSISAILTAAGENLAVGSVYQWGTGAAIGSNIINGQTTASLTISPSSTTTYWVRILDCSGTYTTNSVTKTITVNPKPTTPTFSKTDIDCINATGSITVTVQSAGETYSFDNGATFQTSNVNSDLGVGSYNVIIKSAAGCNSLATAAIVIADKSSTTWTTAGWSNDYPSSTKKIIFDGDYTFGTNLPASDLAGCSCEVLSGTITVPDGFTLTLTNELKVTGGSLTFDNNASLVQTSTTATNNNTGKIYYKRHTTPVRRYDYTYWSSPVQPQTMIALSPNTLSDKFWSFDSDANDWVLSDGGGATMQPVNGYSIRAPQTFDIVTPAIDTAPTFFGVPNNGNYSFPSTATAANNKSYLLGNPYPSALDAITFLSNNSGVLDGTLYFWTHNSNVTPVGAFYEYSDNDYASFNLTGGTGTVAALNTGVNNSIPSGKIAAGQGFFATGIATGTVNFTNAMRVGVGSITGNNSQFFRTSKTKAKTTTAIEKNRVWLNLYNDQGAFKQALIGYVTGATNEYDSGYDGESFDGNEFVDFYSVTPENYLVIQGRALPFDETDTVPLGYRSAEDMNLNISIDQTDGLLATQNVFIEDKVLHVIHNIKDTPYAFTTQAGTFDDRFVLRYTDKTLGKGDFNPLSNQIIISKDKNELKIKSELETIKRVTVFDLLGRKVFEKDTEDSNEFRSSSVSLSKQIGVVKVTLTNGKVISKKVRF